MPTRRGRLFRLSMLLRCPVTRDSLLPSFTQRVLGKPRLRLCTEDLGKLCSPGLEIQSLVNFHHRVTAKSHSSGQGGLPRRALCPCPLGDSATSGPVSLPSHSHHWRHRHLLMHLERARGLGCKRWWELMPEVYTSHKLLLILLGYNAASLQLWK